MNLRYHKTEACFILEMRQICKLMDSISRDISHPLTISNFAYILLFNFTIYIHPICLQRVIARKSIPIQMGVYKVDANDRTS
jgi:hypothetical protein